MDDEDDRCLLDIIGDVQALNDYLHGSGSKSIDEDDVTNATFGSASSFFTSSTGDPVSALKDGSNHLDDMGLQLPNSLQFIEEELGRASPLGTELGEEQPFDILQKSLQEADITEQTMAQEALLESTAPSTSFPQQLVSGGVGLSHLPVLQTQGSGNFSGVQPQSFRQQAPPQPLQNGHIQLLGSFNGPPSMMTINSPQASPGLGGGVLVQRQACHTGVVQGAMFNPPAGGQVTVPFKGCGTPVHLQNIIIQRGPSPQMVVKPIQPKPPQMGGQAVYNISGPASSSTQLHQQMTVNIVNEPSLHKPAPGAHVANHSGSIVIHSALGQQQQQQQQSSLPPGQYLLPSSLAFTPGSTTTHTVQAMNGQMVPTEVQGTADQTFVTCSSTSTYPGTFLTNQSPSVQLVAGQNFTAGGQLILNQSVVSSQLGQSSPALVQVCQAPAKNQPGYPTSCSLGPSPVQGPPIQSHHSLVGALDSAHIGYAAQTQGVLGGGGTSGLQEHRFLVPRMQDVPRKAAQGVPDHQFETQLSHQSQDSQASPPTSKLQDGLRQPHLLNLLGNKALKISTALETSVYLPNQLITLKRPASQQLTKGGMILQQLRRDQGGALAANRSPFSYFGDAVHQLLPYHVFQGALPSEDDFRKVDEEFEEAASQVLKRTQAMLNKYRRLLFVEAERTSPSSEIVMIDRTFNQDERSKLTQDKRLALVDPDGYLEDFCCAPKPAPPILGPEVQDVPERVSDPVSRKDLQGEIVSVTGRRHRHDDSPADPSTRTESQPGCKDHGGAMKDTAVRSTLDPKKAQRCSLNVDANGRTVRSSILPAPETAVPRSCSASSPHWGPMPVEPSHAPLTDTDSVLEAAVNSILEC